MVEDLSHDDPVEGAGDASPPAHDRAAEILRDYLGRPEDVVALAYEAADLPAERAEWLCIQVSREVGRVSSASWSRLGEALDEALASDRASVALRVLERWGVLRAVVPEVQAMVGFHRSSPVPHKDLWEHTLKVLEKTPPDRDLRWVALCHDIGKVATRALLGRGHLAFHRHEALGARLFAGIGYRLGMAPARIDRIAAVIEHHPRVHQFEASWTDRAVARLVRELGEHLPLTLAFSAADWTSTKAREAQRIRRNLELLSARIAALGHEDGRRPKAPEGFAEVLVATSDRAPGGWVRDALAWAAEGVAEGSLAGLSNEALARRWRERETGDTGDDS
ncbi:MAG: HD domain-containing protein [Deltaproteobacteria bacterium]|nr:HD domain-containing protein [Deltaproteobacteria bacterium]